MPGHRRAWYILLGPVRCGEVWSMKPRASAWEVLHSIFVVGSLGCVLFSLCAVVEPRALSMLGQCSNSESHLQLAFEVVASPLLHHCSYLYLGEG